MTNRSRREYMQVSEKWVREAYAAFATSLMSQQPLAPGKEYERDGDDTILMAAKLVVDIEAFWINNSGKVLPTNENVVRGSTWEPTGQDLCDSIEEWVDAIGPVAIYEPGLTHQQKLEIIGLEYIGGYPDPYDPTAIVPDPNALPRRQEGNGRWGIDTRTKNRV